MRAFRMSDSPTSKMLADYRTLCLARCRAVTEFSRMHGHFLECHIFKVYFTDDDVGTFCFAFAEWPKFLY